jgi:hypothetical protein
MDALSADARVKGLRPPWWGGRGLSGAWRIRRTLPADNDPRHDIRARYDAAGIVAALLWWLHHTTALTAEQAAEMTHHMRTAAGLTSSPEDEQR